MRVLQLCKLSIPRCRPHSLLPLSRRFLQIELSPQTQQWSAPPPPSPFTSLHLQQPAAQQVHRSPLAVPLQSLESGELPAGGVGVSGSSRAMRLALCEKERALDGRLAEQIGAPEQKIAVKYSGLPERCELHMNRHVSTPLHCAKRLLCSSYFLCFVFIT